MASAVEPKTILRGCSFLIEDHPLDLVLIPEELTEEQRQIGELTREFVEGSVRPKTAQIESQDFELMRALAREAGEIGLLGIDIPEAYGGFGQTKAVSMLVAENLARAGSFQVLHAAHTGIGTLPIVYFGTRAQKEKYLPKLATGEWIGAYALTEAGSGSDALAAKTRAVPTDDGSGYVLTGEKMFITNSGIAHLFVVFAQVVVPGANPQFTAFLVERDTPGLSLGAEEKKMGLKGSSTRSVVLDGVHVSAEQVLGEVGRGHVIAFNILNVGRFKLGAGAVGGGIDSIVEAVRYGKDRKQFGRSITDFGLIRHKIGEAAARLYAAHSMVYRTAGYIDQNIATLDEGNPSYDRQVIEIGVHEYATECSMMKVFCSEVLDYCVDEAVQIHGGYGYIAEYDAERHYRDSRINRIWEGTNEINRLVIMNEVLRKALKNELPIFARAKALQDELTGFHAHDAELSDEPLAEERRLTAQAKKAVLLTIGTAAREAGEGLREAQEVLGLTADMLIDVYGMESCILRATKLRQRGDTERAAIAETFTKLFVATAIERVDARAREALAAVAKGDLLTAVNSGLRRLLKRAPVDVVALRRAAAAAIIEVEEWPL